MKHSFASISIALLAICCSSGIARSAPAMSPATVGVGPHGYDFLIGTWTCKNSVPSDMGGPATTTVTIARSGNGPLSFHAAGQGFATMGYIVYASKTRTWWNPSAVASGGYGTESTQQTGEKTVWAGPFVDPSSGKTTQVRDTYTFSSPTMYTDLYQVNVAGAWKTEGNSTCTKT